MDCITNEIIEEAIESAYLAVNQLSNAEIKAIESFSKIIENAHNGTVASSDATTASEIVNSCYCAREVDEIVTQILELAYSSCTDSDGQNTVIDEEPINEKSEGSLDGEKSIIDEEQVTVNTTAKAQDLPESDGKINEIESIVDVNPESVARLIVQYIDKVDDCNNNKANDAIHEEALKIDSVAEHLDCESHESDDSIVVDSIEIRKNEEDMPSIEIIPDETSDMGQVNEESSLASNGQTTLIEKREINVEQANEKREADLDEPKAIIDEDRDNEKRETDLDVENTMVDEGQVNEKREADLSEQNKQVNGNCEACVEEPPSSINEGQVNEKREADLSEQNAVVDERLVNEKREIDEDQANKHEADVEVPHSSMDEGQVNEERDTYFNGERIIVDEGQFNKKHEANLDGQKVLIDEQQENGKLEADLSEQKEQANEKREAHLDEHHSSVDEEKINEQRETDFVVEKTTVDGGQANEKREADLNEQKAVIDKVQVNKKREIEDQANKHEADVEVPHSSIDEEQANEKREADLDGQMANEGQFNEKQDADLNERKSSNDEGQVNEKRETNSEVQKSVINASPAKSTTSARNEFYSDDELHSKGYFMKFIGDVKLVTNLSIPSVPAGMSKVLCRIPPNVTHNELIPTLEKCGRIYGLRFVATGVVIVTYMSVQESTNAIKMLNGRIVRGTALKVEKYCEKKQLHVSPIPVDARKHELSAYFDKLTRGLVLVYILNQPEHPSKNRGYCYLTYKDYECASEAKEIISNSLYDGRKMNCDYAERQIILGDRMPLFKIFMNNLRPGLTSTNLRKLFSAFGEVIEVDKNNNWASVKFRNAADTHRAFNHVDKKLLGNDVHISFSELRKN